MPSRTYGNLIWTNHALDRLADRKLDQNLAWQAYRYPDEVLQGKEAGTTEYRKRIHTSLITMIIKKDDGKQIVLSCWIDPPLSGTQDDRKRQDWKRYQKASWWMKWILTFKRQLGL
jgi:hypothetical protein